MKIGIKLPSFARLWKSKNREKFFFVSPSPTAYLSMVLVRQENKNYGKPNKKIKQSIRSIPEGLNWGLTEDDLP